MARRSAARPLSRLLSDTGGNTLAMMAIAIFPLAGLVGGGVDMSRLYLVKSRLQQACDSGALAGRRVMGGDAWAANNGAANAAALQYFAGNFQTGAYGTNNLTRSYTEAAGKVKGTAAVTVPMTIMRIFGSTMERLTVVCDAEMQLASTDIMFVLDTTGSMNNKAVDTDTDTKIVTLKKAVKCFYETVARLDTTAVCGSGAGPTGGTGSQVQIRFGFMPYATNVNVGRLLPTAYFADSWKYQSREAVMKDAPPTTTTGATTLVGEEKIDIVTGAYTAGGKGSEKPAASDVECQALKPASIIVSKGTEGAPENQKTTTGNPRTETWDTRQAYEETEYRATYSVESGGKAGGSKGICVIDSRKITYKLLRHYSRSVTDVAAEKVFDTWRYAQLTKDIGALKNGTSWNSNLSLPIGNVDSTGKYPTSKTISWDGCIEERQTVRTTDYSPIPDDAKDLDIDLVPSSGSPESLWGPALKDLIYTRRVINDINQLDASEFNSTLNYYVGGSYSCPAQASKLRAWPTASNFETYVDGLTPSGNTYHDIGMIWGARFMSPDGIFASENRTTPGGGKIERHLIFMTDGDTQTSSFNYAAYGVPYFDRRQTATTAVPTSAQLDEQVDLRFTALCETVKNKNITLWVVSFGTLNAATDNRLRSCATPGRFFNANNSADLITTFGSIAEQISQLRLTQ